MWHALLRLWSPMQGLGEFAAGAHLSPSVIDGGNPAEGTQMAT